MKRSLSGISLLALSALAPWFTGASAQPTWRFHLAFEDGTGTRDTIWMLYDTTATLPVDPFPGPNVDTALGEGGVIFDYTEFNVWVRNALWDSTKTYAMPYSWYPVHSGTTIDAFNWVPPITIRWDTALFHAPYLPTADTIRQATMGGTYFFFNNNHPEIHAFDMLLTDSVVISVDADLLFPTGVYFSGDELTSIAEGLASEPNRAVPNPTNGLVRLPFDADLNTLVLTDRLGRVVLNPRPAPTNNVLDLSQLPDGIYLIRGTTASNHLYHEKVIKQGGQ